MENEKNKLKEFSVLMSVYKNDIVDFFEEALKSVTVKQKLKPAQVVIVKDGPVINNIDKIIVRIREEEPDIEITICENSTNKGLAASLNKGIAACKYEYIARMDADDISTPDRFYIQRKFCVENPSYGLIGSYISEFNYKINDINSLRKVPIEQEKIVEMMKTRNPFNHMSVMYKKSDVIKAGGYSENIGKLEDYKLWIDMALNGTNLHNIPAVLVNVRVGNGFIKRRSSREEIVDWDDLQNYLLQNRIIGIYKSYINKAYIRMFTYTPDYIKIIFYKYVLRQKNNKDV
ncbi:MAG: glycosyltransferase [Selenomonas sp.]|jgi:glycosyltransferase involved in cell wall biosynthesis|nr:glycosyltransferase [Selenomonas sp.]